MPTFAIQPLRGEIQALISSSLTAAGVPLSNQVWDNVQDTPPADPDGTYAVVSVSFTRPAVSSIGCGGLDAPLGNATVTILAPKGQGAQPAEDIACAVLADWCAANKLKGGADTIRLRTYDHVGPAQLPPGPTPHAQWYVGCSFTGRVP